MKKLLAIVLAVAFTIALAVPAFAVVNLDAVGGSIVKSQSTININPGDKLYIIGWAYCGSEQSALKEMFYTLDGVEKALPDNYRDRPDVAGAFNKDGQEPVVPGGPHTGFGKDDDLMELTGIDALPDGTYTIEICARYENNETEVGHTFTLVVGDGGSSAPTTEEHTAVAGVNNPVDGKAIWMNQPGEYAAAKFTTTGAFTTVKLTTFWASEMSKEVPVTYTLELFKFDTNIETSMSKAPVETTTVVAVTNGNPPAVLNLSAPAEAGTYVFKVSVGGDHLNGTNDGSYMVLDHAAEAEVPNIEYQVNAGNKGNGTFAFIVVGDVVEGEFFAANPAEGSASGGDTPVNPPATGDASLVIFVIAAVAVALVVLKKKAF